MLASRGQRTLGLSSYRTCSSSQLHVTPCSSSRPRRSPRTQQQRCIILASAQSNESFGESIMRVAKQIQGSLPIVGLLSRLASPEGGFDDLAYTEYSRSIIEKSSEEMQNALADFEKRYGKVGSSRFALLLLWMSKTALGWVQPRDIVGAARRMRVTQDIEIEIDRIDMAKSEKKAKYEMMAAPESSIRDQVTVAVDSICTLCLGLKDGVPVKEEDVPGLISIVNGGLGPEASKELVASCIASRPERATAY
ncbi:hypothetical protein DUNSADRAFT_11115 [Dunaliella salina]|uniref:Uncharacterized protein n=1 Tax=Dunaliella salina TaxID=3046 RepID=A0ABQ7H4L4_DUNSA|nr:hypothetical protein DUNSADRAFT_11115 [Dunaliella salina]|eukprot:KAF5841799.1 hypothetical protein DUNSADRAFT_11115 [Dunaliella salina]